jgi:uncharacterized integral membrane protein
VVRGEELAADRRPRVPEQKWQAPLVFVLLVTFVAGVVIGLLAWIPTVVRQRRELAS